MEAIEDIKQRLKSLKEHLSELLRQDRAHNQAQITNLVKESEQRCLRTIDALRQNLFDIFNEQTSMAITPRSLRNSDDHHDIGIANEVHRMK